MPAEWEELYRQALQELAAERVCVACERARRAINDRLIELAAHTTHSEKERERLFEALRGLVIHEQNLRPPG